MTSWTTSSVLSSIPYMTTPPTTYISRTITPVLNLPTQLQIRVGTKDTVCRSRDIACRQLTVGRNFGKELPPLTRCSAAMSSHAGSQKRFVLHLYQGGSYCYLEWTNIGIWSLQRLLCLNHIDE